MVDVAVLTPDPRATEHGLWRTVLSRLQQALSLEGVTAVPTPWTAHADDASELRGYARVLPLLAWGYHLQAERWLGACRRWQDAGVAMANPAQVLAWNADKRYLSELAARGIAIPGTRWMCGLDAAVLEQAFNDFDAAELVVKPSVSGGAWKTLRVRRERLDAVIAAEGNEVAGVDLLVQPYLPTIETEGETSLLFFGGRLSHVVNKRPVPGDFRVQEEYGGLYTTLGDPPVGAVALAEQVLAAIDAPLLYARIDLVPDRAGRWLLMEAELIEPDFYLGMDPRHGAGFAVALAAAIRGMPPGVVA